MRHPIGFLFLVAGLLGVGAMAQQAGHSTVPTTGPTGQGGFATAPREADPLLTRIEQIRRDLSEIGKLYKKTKGPERAERQRELMTVLDRVQEEVSAAREKLTPR